MTLTAKELFKLVDGDPNWIGKNATRENPVTVLGCCVFDGDPIESLSPYITFLGDPYDPKGELKATSAVFGGNCSASFIGCPNLKVAAGTFHGHVDFSESAVEEIDPGLTAFPTPKFPGYETPEELDSCASFRKCPNLKVARGTYHGTVRFSESAIETIADLRVTKTNERGTAAVFMECKKLKVATGTYPGAVIFSRSGIEKIVDLTVESIDQHGWAGHFQDCPNLKVLSGTFAGAVKANMCPNLVAIHNLHQEKGGAIEVEHCPIQYCQENLLEEGREIFTPKQAAKIRKNLAARKALKKPLENEML